MKVLKFGGSSVANPENIEKVRNILSRRIKKEKILVVFSAFQGITNQLIQCAKLAAAKDINYKKECQSVRDRHLVAVLEMVGKELHATTEQEIKSLLSTLEELCYGVYLLGELSNRTKDQIVSYGERLSTTIISASFATHGIPNELLDPRKLIITDNNFTNASVNLPLTYQTIQQAYPRENQLTIVPGFIGATTEGITTTLGRGGSDYTAAIFAHALDAEVMEKWTDVSGMMSSDPRLVKSSQVINKLSYQEAMELCHFGAKVIYPPTIHPLLEKHIPILIKNTFKPDDPGTFIFKNENPKNGAVKGLSSISGISLLTLSGSGMVGVPGFSKRMFSALSKESVNIILITQASSEHSITVAINTEDTDRAVHSLNEEFVYDKSINKIEEIVVEHDLAIIAMVGDNMQYQAGISGKSLYTLGKNGVNIRAIAQGSSERNISVVLENKNVKKALNSLHESFFESGIKRIHLFLLGVGNVGGTLINQIQKQKKELLDKHLVDIKVVGMASSKKMLFNEEGIDLSNWKTQLDKSVKMEMNSFIFLMKKMNMRNSVFVDNTASKDVGDKYLEILQSSIAVVASNKTAASSDYSTYQKLKNYALKYNTSFLNETNVGAGLPIIDTIQNLIKSGDEIEEIHAVLSGSLNFIFNNFTSTTDFVDVVKAAMREGYTEPDPRIDLSGVDVQRKILILARESGMKIEMKDIENLPFLPEKLLNEGNVEDFLSGLITYGKTMEKKRKEAEERGEKLKYVASLIKGKASVGLQSVAKDHPFYMIEGKDNIVMLSTKRYQDQPMVIKGAGAGAEVTAMGVFADIIRLAND